MLNIDWDSHPAMEVPPAKPRKRSFDPEWLNFLGAVSTFVLVFVYAWAYGQQQNHVDNCQPYCHTRYMDTIIETENTGPVTRVWVDALYEEDALRTAKEHLGTDALADVVYHNEGSVWEVIFETADLN